MLEFGRLVHRFWRLVLPLLVVATAAGIGAPTASAATCGTLAANSQPVRGELDPGASACWTITGVQAGDLVLHGSATTIKDSAGAEICASPTPEAIAAPCTLTGAAPYTVSTTASFYSVNVEIGRSPRAAANACDRRPLVVPSAAARKFVDALGLALRCVPVQVKAGEQLTLGAIRRVRGIGPGVIVDPDGRACGSVRASVIRDCTTRTAGIALVVPARAFPGERGDTLQRWSPEPSRCTRKGFGRGASTVRLPEPGGTRCYWFQAQAGDRVLVTSQGSPACTNSRATRIWAPPAQVPLDTCWEAVQGVSFRELVVPKTGPYSILSDTEGERISIQRANRPWNCKSVRAAGAGTEVTGAAGADGQLQCLTVRFTGDLAMRRLSPGLRVHAYQHPSGDAGVCTDSTLGAGPDYDPTDAVVLRCPAGIVNVIVSGPSDYRLRLTSSAACRNVDGPAADDVPAVGQLCIPRILRRTTTFRLRAVSPTPGATLEQRLTDEEGRTLCGPTSNEYLICRPASATPEDFVTEPYNHVVRLTAGTASAKVATGALAGTFQLPTAAFTSCPTLSSSVERQLLSTAGSQNCVALREGRNPSGFRVLDPAPSAGFSPQITALRADLTTACGPFRTFPAECTDSSARYLVLEHPTGASRGAARIRIESLPTP
ncbi:MAG: hypothetical protein JHD16_17010, partial [Solirubrobacteraceae bacterium]|nr:hypothetical protein [Solirubrobacteraceae bacterium]